MSNSLINVKQVLSKSFESLPSGDNSDEIDSNSSFSRSITPVDSSPVLLVTASYDHTIRFWDVLLGSCLATLQHNESQVNCLKISPDKRFLAVGGNPNVRIFDISETLSTSALASRNSPDFSASTANIQAKNILQNHAGNVVSIGFPDSNLWMFTASTDGSIKIWDFPGLKCQKEFQNKSSSINKAILHPNQAEIIFGDESGHVKVLDLLKGSFSIEMCPEDNVPVTCVAITDDGELLAMVNEKGNLYIWTCNSNQTASNGFTPLTRIKSAHKPHSTLCLFSPNSQILITSGSDGIVKKWTIDPKKKEILNSSSSLIGHSNWVWDASFSADSSFVLTGASDNTARLWDINSGETICIYSGHSKAITAVTMNDSIIT